MILTEIVKIKIMGKNIEHFKKLGHEVNYGEIIEIPVDHLSDHSCIKILVKCDICGNEKKKPYAEYIELVKNQNFYSCQKCKSLKRKKQ